MAQYPQYTLAGSNQFPAVATAIPSQYPVIELVDSTGTVLQNVGNGAADGTWNTMILTNGYTAGSITPQYMKDSRGKVHCRGRLVSPSGLVVATSCWSIPVGFRPLVGSRYFDWPNGGSNAGTEGDPRTVAVMATSFISPNYNGAGSPETAAGIVHDISRWGWSTL